MSEAEPSDLSKDGWRTESWESIEARYRESVERYGHHWFGPLAELAARVQESGIGRSLHAAATMDGLMCMMHAVLYVDEPRLVILAKPDRTYTFEFRHPKRPPGRRNEDWNATYPADQVLPAFSRFLGRVGWIPEGHPAHAILLGKE